MHYYNEFNPESAAMLRQMMQDGIIPKGDVDERSITEISPDDLRGYTQCHFFAGIGGWSIALAIAGWPEDRNVWTGSCPCQPFSSAGRQKGKADDRHLWPVWERLISECRPATVFGEQVASAIAHGWLDDVYDGLEAQGYAVGSAVLPACSVGAPHKRDRLWFVADSESLRGREGHKNQRGCDPRNGAEQGAEPFHDCYRNVADSQSIDGWAGLREAGTQQNRIILSNGGSHSFDGQWIDCPDGKQRLIEPSIFLLVDGFQHRRPILHAIGNAIVPQVAAEFIKATM